MSTINDTAALNQLGLANRLPSDKNRLGQEEFLMLMTKQLTNQDPMKPMESGDFLGQIAQFGTVSGIEDLQKSFSQLASSLSSNQSLQAAALIDREVLVPSEYANLPDGGTVKGAVALERSATDVVFRVYDTNGELVRRISTGAQTPGIVEFTWDGKAEDGTRMPPGEYEIRAEAQSGNAAEAQEVLIASRVQSVSISPFSGALKLRLEYLGDIDFSKVRQIG